MRMLHALVIGNTVHFHAGPSPILVGRQGSRLFLLSLVVDEGVFAARFEDTNQHSIN
jgi:hypothetical protein